MAQIKGAHVPYCGVVWNLLTLFVSELKYTLNFRKYLIHLSLGSINWLYKTTIILFVGYVTNVVILFSESMIVKTSNESHHELMVDEMVSSDHLC